MNNTLIVLNYNDSDTTIKFIEGIKTFSIIESIVIVDNNSSDNSYDRLKCYESKKIKVIRTPYNGGYAFGNNFAVMFAEKEFNPEYLIICNPDIIFEEKVVKKILDYLKNNKDVAIATARMRSFYPGNHSIIGWNIPTFKDEVIASLRLLGRFILKRNIIYDYEYLDKPEIFVEAVPGSFFAIKAKVFREVGYFDEKTFLYVEESILGIKLKSKGYSAVVLGDIEFVHAHSTTINKLIGKKIMQYKILQNSRKYYLKQYLKVSKFKLFIFDIVTALGKLEIIAEPFKIKLKCLFKY